MISLIFALIFFIIFIFLCIAGGNFVLKSMIENVLSKKENFENFDNNENLYNNIIVNPVDDCRKIDQLSQDNLNFQTATNIPLSPNNYKNYIGSIYMNDNDNYVENKSELHKGKYCLKKSKLLYDGIWDPTIHKESPYEYESWKLTNGNLSDDYYCSNKLLEVNKPFPENYIDKSATPPIVGGEYYTYFNDTQDDIYDTEIQCFPSVFNAGITEDLKKKGFY
jgi:hypothetical protein